MNRERLQKLAGIITEAEQLTPNKPGDQRSSAIKSIEKDLQDQSANFSFIKDVKKTEDLFNIIVSKLDPKFLQSSQFKSFIKKFALKYQ
jgi:hypothetical protein